MSRQFDICSSTLAEEVAGMAAGPDTSPGVPAVAERPPEPREAAGDRPVPQLERSAGRLLGVSVAQIVCWEVAAAAVLASVVRRDWTMVPAGLLAVAVGALTLVRRRGRWLYEIVAVRLRLRSRRRWQPARPEVDLRLAALAELRPELSVSDVEQRAGRRLGFCNDGTAWVGLVAVQAGDDELAAALVVDDIELAAVQLLCHIAPAPSGTLPGTSPVASSYQQVKAGRTPASQQVWVALRLDPARCPEAD